MGRSGSLVDQAAAESAMKPCFVAYNAWMRHSLSAARRQQPRAGRAAQDGAARGFGLEAVFAGRPGSY